MKHNRYTAHPLVQALRAARESAGLAQVDIADALHLNPRSVGQWERGERTPDLWTLTAYASVVGVELTTTPSTAVNLKEAS